MPIEQQIALKLPNTRLITPDRDAVSLMSQASIAVANAALLGMEQQAQLDGYKVFLDTLHAGVEHDEQTGLTSALLQSDPESPSEQITVLIGGFGMRMEEIVRLAEYWRRVHQELGQPTDVLAFGLPRHAKEALLSPAERIALDSGDLTPIASRVLDVTQRRTAAKTVKILAYSYGNVIAWPLARAAVDRGLNIPAVLGCALPNPRPGGGPARMAGFLGETLLVRGKYPDGTPGVFTHKDKRYPVRLAEIIGELPAIQRRLARNNAEAEIASLRQKSPDTAIILAAGGADWIGRSKHIRRLLARLGTQPGGDLFGVLYEGAHHAWGRILPLLGQLAFLALLEEANLGLFDKKEDAGAKKAVG